MNQFNLLVALLMFLTPTAWGQLSFMGDKFTTPQTTTVGLSICDMKDLGIRIPISDEMLQYDRLSYSIYKRSQHSPEVPFNQQGDAYNVEHDFTNKEFLERRSTPVDLYVFYEHDDVDASTQPRQLFNFIVDCEKPYTYKSLNGNEFKVVIHGEHKIGIYTYWDEPTNSYQNRPVYDDPIKLAESPVFSFEFDKAMTGNMDEKLTRRPQNSKAVAQYEQIKKKYLVEEYIPYVGKTRPRAPIFKAYELLYQQLVDDANFDTLFAANDKLLKLEDRFPKLKRLLNRQTDPNRIQAIILNF